MSFIFTNLLFTDITLLFVFVVVDVLAINKWRGPWRWLAVMPLLVIGYYITRIIVDTSHNLWPIEILILSGLGLGFLGFIQLLKLFLSDLEQDLKH